MHMTVNIDRYIEDMEQLKDYKNRVEKAINHIKNNTVNDTFSEWYDGEVEDLLNILEGKSDE